MATDALHEVEAPILESKSEVREEETAAEENCELEEEEAEKENVDPEAEAEEDDDKAEEVEVEEEEEAEEGVPAKKRAKRGRKGQSMEVTPEKKEQATPTSDRPTRERKSVDRYSAPSATKFTPSKVLEIVKGSGTQLKDIPNVAFKLSKRKADGNLQVLHAILFGKKAKANRLKRNISQFSGFLWVENEEKQRAKVRERLDKCVKDKLVDFCDVLNIQINKAAMKKEEISAKLLEFLESPHATTEILLSDKEQKAKKCKKAASGKRVSPGEASDDITAKRQKTSEGGKKRKRSSKNEGVTDDKVESPEVRDDSHENSDNEANLKEESDHSKSKSDEEDEEEDEPKEQMSNHKISSKKFRKETSGAIGKDKPEPVKESTREKSVKSRTKSAKKLSSSTSKNNAAHSDATSGSLSKSKGPASKKQKVEKESPKSQSKDKNTGRKQSSKSPSKNSVTVQGNGKSSKSSKPELSREEMHAIVAGILKEVDFNTATLSDILRQLGTHFDVDLMHRKAEVKDIITEVINNMSDEEEEDDEDGDEKDEGSDDDA